MSDRFMRKGTAKVWWVPTIADTVTLVPTAAEVNGGTELTASIAAINGFSFSNSPIDTPDMGESFVSKIPGEDTVENSSIEFYEKKTTEVIRASQSKDSAGYVVIFARGIAGATPAAADECDVWPATIGSNSRMYSAGNEAAKFNVVYTLTGAPAEDVAVAV